MRCDVTNKYLGYVGADIVDSVPVVGTSSSLPQGDSPYIGIQTHLRTYIHALTYLLDLSSAGKENEKCLQEVHR